MPKQLPNIITCIRIALIPVFAAFYLTKRFGIAVAILALVMLSDLVDGYIARKYSLQSRTGELLDPLADKLALVMVCVCLYATKLVPLWFFVAIIAKEIFMLCCGLIANFVLKKQSAISKAKWYGKLATVSLYTVLCANFVFPSFFLEHAVLRFCGFVFALFWEYFAFVNYGLIYLKTLKNNKTPDDQVVIGE